MTLPKWATTVTPLSKTLAIIIFILFPIIGFILGMKYQEVRTISQEKTITRLPTPAIFSIEKISPTPTVFIVSQSSTVIPTDKVSVIPTPSEKFAPFFKKIIITFNNGIKIDNYYTSSWFWCGGSNGERVLNSTYSPYLELAGKTSQENNVYLLKESAPYPEDQHLIPSTKKTKYEGENGELVLQEDWSKFLSSQTDNYPIIIFKDSSERMIMYIRQDFLYLPGC